MIFDRNWVWSTNCCYFQNETEKYANFILVVVACGFSEGSPLPPVLKLASFLLLHGVGGCSLVGCTCHSDVSTGQKLKIKFINLILMLQNYFYLRLVYSCNILILKNCGLTPLKCKDLAIQISKGHGWHFLLMIATKN